MMLGGAKPVPVDPRNYRNFKRGDIIVSLAGVFDESADRASRARCSSSIVGLVGRCLPRRCADFRHLAGDADSWASDSTLVLIAFNLIPIPPLDGSHVMKYLLPAVVGAPVHAVRTVWALHRADRADVSRAAGALSFWLKPAITATYATLERGERQRPADHEPMAAMSASLIDAPLRRGSIRDDAFVVELPAFSGPLDLLLSLIREEQVDIYDIPIARICRAVLCAHSHARTERGRRVSRDGGATAAHQGADAAAARRRARRGTIRAPSSFGACSSINRCARSSTCSSAAAKSGATSSRARICRRRPRRRKRRSRCRCPSCSPPSIACCARSRSRTCTTSFRARSTFRARSRSFARVLALRARIMWTEIVENGAEPWQILSTLLGLLELAKLGELRVAQPRPFANVEIIS